MSCDTSTVRVVFWGPSPAGSCRALEPKSLSVVYGWCALRFWLCEEDSSVPCLDILTC
jgi:hypothetical protein